MSVKPLNDKNVIELLKRFDNARDSVIHSITPHSPTSISIELSVQDTNRGYDWINVAFKIDGVSDAKLVNDLVFSSIDMSYGVSISIEPNYASFAIGDYRDARDSALYIIGANIGYSELEYR